MSKYSVESIKGNEHNVAEEIIKLMSVFKPFVDGEFNLLYNSVSACLNKTDAKKYVSNLQNKDNDALNGFEYWKIMFASNEKMNEGLTKLETKYNEIVKSTYMYRHMDFGKYASNFMLGMNETTNSDYMINTKLCLTKALEDMEKNDKSSLDSVCSFFEKLNNTKKVTTLGINYYAKQMLEKIEESGISSARNSDVSGQMYKKLKEVSETLKKEEFPDAETVNDLRGLAQKYLEHKAKDGYNEKAWGKIVAADAILRLTDQIDRRGNSLGLSYEDTICLKDTNKQSVSKILDSVKVRETSKKEKFSFSKLLKEEMKKNLKEEKKVKITSHHKNNELRCELI